VRKTLVDALVEEIRVRSRDHIVPVPPQLAPTAAAAAREVAVRAAPAEAIALQGCVLTPTGPVADAFVVVGAGHTIQAVQSQQPQGVRVHATGGVILPGLLDLHGHPEFNVFAAWEPPKLSPTATCGAAARSTRRWSATPKTGCWTPAWLMRSCGMPRSARWSAG
jgi:hypothetical protein